MLKKEVTKNFMSMKEANIYDISYRDVDNNPLQIYLRPLLKDYEDIHRWQNDRDNWYKHDDLHNCQEMMGHS